MQWLTVLRLPCLLFLPRRCAVSHGAKDGECITGAMPQDLWIASTLTTSGSLSGNTDTLDDHLAEIVSQCEGLSRRDEPCSLRLTFVKPRSTQIIRHVVFRHAVSCQREAHAFCPQDDCSNCRLALYTIVHWRGTIRARLGPCDPVFLCCRISVACGVSAYSHLALACRNLAPPEAAVGSLLRE